MSDEIVNFDPNLNFCGNRAFKKVRLTFALWDYRLTREVTVSGNCSGLTNIKCAVSQVYDDVCDTGIQLLRANGDTLQCDDDEDNGEDWLSDMLIAAEITDIWPQKDQKAEAA